MAQLSKEEATTKAKILCDTLKMSVGGHWQPRVHENLGWHYAAILGSMSVSFNGRNQGYSCLISHTPEAAGGLAMWSVTDNRMDGEEPQFKTPAAAVRASMAQANRVLKAMNDVITNNTILMLS